MMHIRWQTRYDDTEFRSRLARDWTEAALYYYSRYYNIGDEPTDEEHRLVQTWRKTLRDTMPDTLRSGVHLLRERAGCMGEGVYVVDGRIDHAMHRGHKECSTYALVGRSDETVWCAKCQRAVSDDETAQDVRR